MIKIFYLKMIMIQMLLLIQLNQYKMFYKMNNVENIQELIQMVKQKVKEYV